MIYSNGLSLHDGKSECSQRKSIQLKLAGVKSLKKLALCFIFMIKIALDMIPSGLKDSCLLKIENDEILNQRVFQRPTFSNDIAKIGSTRSR